MRLVEGWITVYTVLKLSFYGGRKKLNTSVKFQIMKIISKYKDYYDYLVGVYGEDPKLVLDRRNGDPTPYMSERSKFSLYIGGFRVDGILVDKEFYYGEDLKKFPHRELKSYTHLNEKDYEIGNAIYLQDGLSRFSSSFSTVLIKDQGNINILMNCPIVLEQFSKKSKFPILSLLNLQKFLPPEKIFLILSDWLSSQITESEKLIDKRNDTLKLESKGFDKKTSFRPNIKN